MSRHPTFSFEDSQAWYSHSTFAPSKEDGMLYEYEGEGGGEYDSYTEGEGEYKGQYVGE